MNFFQSNEIIIDNVNRHCDDAMRIPKVQITQPLEAKLHHINACKYGNGAKAIRKASSSNEIRTHTITNATEGLIRSQKVYGKTDVFYLKY